MTINERFFNLLKSNNCTQKSFCDKTGISNKTVSAWKTRKSDPPANLLSTIADFFTVPLEYLITGNNIEQSIPSPDGKELLNIYEMLDNRGRHRLHTIAYEELDRIEHEACNNESEKDIG